MSKRQMNLDLGGTTRTLRFNVCTLQCIQEITGQDPLHFKVQSEKWADILPYAINLVHASLLSEYKSKRQQPDFTDEDIKAWVDDLSANELTDVINNYNAIFAKQ
jgi:hypothetical protein